MSVLDKGIPVCDIFSFSVAKPADFVPFRQVYMYQHTLRIYKIDYCHGYSFS